MPSTIMATTSVHHRRLHPSSPSPPRVDLLSQLDPANPLTCFPTVKTRVASGSWCQQLPVLHARAQGRRRPESGLLAPRRLGQWLERSGSLPAGHEGLDGQNQGREVKGGEGGFFHGGFALERD